MHFCSSLLLCWALVTTKQVISADNSNECPDLGSLAADCSNEETFSKIFTISNSGATECKYTIKDECNKITNLRIKFREDCKLLSSDSIEFHGGLIMSNPDKRCKASTIGDCSFETGFTKLHVVMKFEGAGQRTLYGKYSAIDNDVGETVFGIGITMLVLVVLIILCGIGCCVGIPVAVCLFVKRRNERNRQATAGGGQVLYTQGQVQQHNTLTQPFQPTTAPQYPVPQQPQYSVPQQSQYPAQSYQAPSYPVQQQYGEPAKQATIASAPPPPYAELTGNVYMQKS